MQTKYTQMNVIDCLEKALQLIIDADEIICNADLQDAEVQSLIAELQVALEQLQH